MLGARTIEEVSFHGGAPANLRHKDVIPVHPGERFDAELVGDNPGLWASHCHIVHHATNNDVEPGELLFVVTVRP